MRGCPPTRQLFKSEEVRDPKLEAIQDTFDLQGKKAFCSIAKCKYYKKNNDFEYFFNWKQYDKIQKNGELFTMDFRSNIFIKKM